jgi:hypothetical protein
MLRSSSLVDRLHYWAGDSGYRWCGYDERFHSDHRVYGAA